jgi:hypothetical protein
MPRRDAFHDLHPRRGTAPRNGLAAGDGGADGKGERAAGRSGGQPGVRSAGKPPGENCHSDREGEEAQPAALTVGELPTAKDCAGVHTVHAVCRDPACGHWQELDLAAIVAAGHGNVPLIHLPLRYSLCGSTGHEIKVSGRSYGLAE